MVTLSNIGIPKDLVGILHPKLKHRFALKAVTEHEEQLAALSVIEGQCVGIDLGTENLNVPQLSDDSLRLQHRTNRLVIWLEDDITCQLMKAVRSLQADARSFTLEVHLLDGANSTLEGYKLSGCQLEALQHSVLSYGDGQDTLSARIKPPYKSMQVLAEQSGAPMIDTNELAYELNGSIARSDNRPTCLKLLQISFAKFEHEICG